jgi:streptogramin lyase
MHPLRPRLPASVRGHARERASRALAAAAVLGLGVLLPDGARAVAADPGDVLIGILSSSDRVVVRVERNTLRDTVLVPPSGFAGGDLALAPDGDLYVHAGTLWRVDVQTGTPTQIGSQTFWNPGGIEIASDGSLLVGATNTHSIHRVDPETGQVLAATGNLACALSCTRASLGDIAVSPDGTLVATLRGRFGGDPGALIEVDVDTGGTSIVAQGPVLERAWGVTAALDGSWLLTEGGPGRILRVDPATGEVTTFALLPRVLTPYRIQQADDGAVIVVSLDGKVSELDPESGSVRLLASDIGARGLAVVPGLPAPPACSNGADDDGDGRRDYPVDPGCAGPEDGTEATPCEDGLDNDRDGAVDAEDPGCDGHDRLASESPQCQDGIDNDGDGWFDHPDDPQCVSPSDNTEQWRPLFGGEGPPACGLLGIEALVPFALVAARRRRPR